MSKILIIGVGGGGRNTVQRMKEIGIADANYITFGGFRDDYVNGNFIQATPESDIPHYNLVKMNGYFNLPYSTKPDEWAELAEAVKDQIKEVIEYNFDKDANGLISKEAIAQKDGLYLIECSGANHTSQELYKYRKGERIWKYFEGENEQSNGCKPTNYEYIPETDQKWQTRLTASVYGLYIVTYTFQDEAEEYCGLLSSYDNNKTLLNVDIKKKNYALIYAHPDESFIDIIKSCCTYQNNQEINWENAKIISSYLLCDYSKLIQIQREIEELENDIDSTSLIKRFIKWIFQKWQNFNKVLKA